MLEFKMEIFELKLKLKLKLFKLSCRYKHFKNIRNLFKIAIYVALVRFNTVFDC